MKKSIDPFKELKRELADLKKEFAKLEKRLTRNEKRTDLTCTSLTVLDSQGRTVASINGKGGMDCVALGIGSGPSHKKLIKMGDSSGSAVVKLCAKNDQESVSISALKGQGAVIQLSDKDGGGCIDFTAAKSGSQIKLYDSLSGQLGVHVLAHHGSSSSVGEIFTFNRENNVTARIPPKK